MLKIVVSRLGSEEFKKFYLWLEPGEHPNYPSGAKDNTHLNLFGARDVSKMGANELKELKLLEEYLKSPKDQKWE